MAILASTSPSPLRLRDVIAFPKTLTGNDLLLGAPAAATDTQLKEYCIQVAHTPSTASTTSTSRTPQTTETIHADASAAAGEK